MRTTSFLKLDTIEPMVNQKIMVAAFSVVLVLAAVLLIAAFIAVIPERDELPPSQEVAIILTQAAPFTKTPGFLPTLLATFSPVPTDTSTTIPTETPQPTATETAIPTETPVPTATPAPTSIYPDSGVPGYYLFAGAGDISSCGAGEHDTAALLAKVNGWYFTLGDNSNMNGDYEDYVNCFEASWGRVKSLLHPSPGNHDYITENASGYYQYFGSAAGDPTKGYYSYDYGDWHIISLNSNCEFVGGCDTGTEQEKWLRADLAANPSTCTLAYWHHPRFSSGVNGTSQLTSGFWMALYEGGVDVVLNGHDHDYERFAPQNPDGVYDPDFGIRQFVVGTGGAFYTPPGRPAANSEFIIYDTYGIFVVALGPTDYYWEFRAVYDGTVLDKGHDVCH